MSLEEFGLNWVYQAIHGPLSSPLKVLVLLSAQQLMSFSARNFSYLQPCIWAEPATVIIEVASCFVASQCELKRLVGEGKCGAEIIRGSVRTSRGCQISCGQEREATSKTCDNTTSLPNSYYLLHFNKEVGSKKVKMEQTTARLRKTFHYPTDNDEEDDLPEALDEEGKLYQLYQLIRTLISRYLAFTHISIQNKRK